jgi:hypothetical protein
MSPLEIVIECCGPDGKRMSIVNLLTDCRARPDDLLKVMAQRDEIFHSARSAFARIMMFRILFTPPRSLHSISQTRRLAKSAMSR